VQTYICLKEMDFWSSAAFRSLLRRGIESWEIGCGPCCHLHKVDDWELGKTCPFFVERRQCEDAASNKGWAIAV
jgi:hypothetical protein